jgi:Ferredoxin-like domain in Api92-like protein
MPNWVNNSIMITTETEGAANWLWLNLTRPHRLAEGGLSEVGFSFHNVIPRPASEDANWYDWNLANWGCKWDASDAVVEIDAPRCQLSLGFDTPWSPPEHIFDELIAQGRRRSFDLDIWYEEENGWGGEIQFRHGLNRRQDVMWDESGNRGDGRITAYPDPTWSNTTQPIRSTEPRLYTPEYSTSMVGQLP